VTKFVLTTLRLKKERRKVDKKKQNYTKTDPYRLYCRVFRTF